MFSSNSQASHYIIVSVLARPWSRVPRPWPLQVLKILALLLLNDVEYGYHGHGAVDGLDNDLLPATRQC